ncbi:gamma-glutamyltransferase family protein [Xanthobacteraceae bacterium Astr-EGSB]|uniref:gamma-glutamyltransferase family protein n=1 Tax=Astrobacterium formosum TaxID=3069710 RepID=UPI0027B20911|nr:gamma-glutamyltransferase family protein [Xanthobacteraceae bacterium Astr-EGSB]
MTRDFQLSRRPPVIAGDAMAATSHPLATLAAIETLKGGGSAADAAVSAVATLCVVEPAMTGIGGDCFCLVKRPGLPAWGYNGSGRSAAGASLDDLLAQGLNAIGPDSVHSVTVPGAVDAWAAILKAHGRFGLDRALKPAIHYAEHGFPIAPRVACDWAMYGDRLKADAGASRHFLVDGHPPREGDMRRAPALAIALKAIAAGGPRVFYEGPIADDIVTTLAARGSFLTLSDFAAHYGEVATPISTSYRGLDVVQMPPNGQGLAALVLLNILEQFDHSVFEPLSAARAHLCVEAARLAYAVRDTHVADPAAMRTTVAALIDKTFAAALSQKLDPAKRVPLPAAPVPGTDTVYVSVVDRDGMAVSMINSLFHAFGAAIATEKTGILLQNRGAGFVLDPDHPNAFAPAKRPMHTIIPALGLTDGECDLCYGVMGGAFQAMGHAWFTSNVVDFGMDVQAAIDLPRLFYEGETTVAESGLPAQTIADLRGLGHDIAVRQQPLGGSQAIAIDRARGVLIGGSDSRKDGCALGY